MHLPSTQQLRQPWRSQSPKNLAELALTDPSPVAWTGMLSPLPSALSYRRPTDTLLSSSQPLQELQSLLQPHGCMAMEDSMDAKCKAVKPFSSKHSKLLKSAKRGQLDIFGVWLSQACLHSHFGIQIFCVLLYSVRWTT